MRGLLFAFILVGITDATQAQEPQAMNSSPEPPQVQVVSQPDSPLRILSVQTKWAVPDRSGIEIFVVIENVKDKAVSSYAARDNSGDAICFLLSANSPGKALRPGRSEGRSTWRGYSPPTSAPLRRLVDFVEFTDGTTWGADSCQSAELLAGQRAGARKARKLLREVFIAGGADAVIETLKSGLPQVDLPPDHIQVWQQGFRSGFGNYIERIRQADQQWGNTEIEYALHRPIDALQENEP